MAAPFCARRTIWLFTRSQGSVRLEAQVGSSNVRLSVYGPGTERALFEFRDLLQLMEHQAHLEWELVAMGYSLQQFIAERPR